MSSAATSETSVFDRVVCGVDGSPAGALAARAAALVTSPLGTLVLLAVDDRSIAVHAGWAAPHVLEQLAAEAQAALARGRDEAEPLHTVEAKLVEGDPRACLTAELVRRDATLAVVGSHGLSRTTGIALGAMSTHLLHKAPCPVLAVRGTIDAGRWPRVVVAGVDGSAESAAALAAARTLAGRTGARIRVMGATEDAHVDVDAARHLAPEVEEHVARALDVLSVASETVDLVVVGSRGMRGLREIGRAHV